MTGHLLLDRVLLILGVYASLITLVIIGLACWGCWALRREGWL